MNNFKLNTTHEYPTFQYPTFQYPTQHLKTDIYNSIGGGGAYLSYTRIGYKAILKFKYLDMTHHINIKFHEESVFRVKKSLQRF